MLVSLVLYTNVTVQYEKINLALRRSHTQCLVLSADRIHRAGGGVSMLKGIIFSTFRCMGDN